MRSISELEPGDHVCLAWENEKSHQRMLTQFLIDGIKNHEKVLYFADSHGPSIAMEYLNKAGFNAGRSLATGQLRALNAESVYLRNRYFDVDLTICLLQSETDRALKEGYTALRVTGETNWFFLNLEGSNRLFEYESKLAHWFTAKRCIGLCQYDCRRFSSSLMRQAVMTHPTVAVNDRMYANPAYLDWPRFQQERQNQVSRSQPALGTCGEIEAFFAPSGDPG